MTSVETAHRKQIAARGDRCPISLINVMGDGPRFPPPWSGSLGDEHGCFFGVRYFCTGTSAFLCAPDASLFVPVMNERTACSLMTDRFMKDPVARSFIGHRFTREPGVRSLMSPRARKERAARSFISRSLMKEPPPRSGMNLCPMKERAARSVMSVSAPSANVSERHANPAAGCAALGAGRFRTAGMRPRAGLGHVRFGFARLVRANQRRSHRH